MAQAKMGDTVRINYSGRLDDGTQFDSSDGHDPLEFKIGENTIIPTLESSVVGMSVGDPGNLTATLTALLDDGVALDAALPAFTTNVATLLRLADKGRIGAGAIADLVVLDERNRVSDVMARGQWLVVDHRPVVVGTFERRIE